MRFALLLASLVALAIAVIAFLPQIILALIILSN